MQNEEKENFADYEKEALDAIKKHKLYTAVQVAAFTSFSRTTFYSYNLDKSDNIKEALYDNAIQAKQSLLSSWGKSTSAPALQISAYKLMGDEDELRRLNNKPKEGEATKEQKPAIILPPKFATSAQQEIDSAIKEGYGLITIQKGRRFGATHYMALFLVDECYSGTYDKVLWGDTINANINKYYDRYFKPRLDKVVGRDNYKFNRVEKVLYITNAKGGDAVIDFRSADRPENWEGFGYDLAFLNEAGIILNNSYIYTNAVRPMLLDNPNSILVAGGVPKGKTDKDGKEHTFLSLCNKARKDDNAKAFHFSSFANTMLSPSAINELIEDLGGKDSIIVKQEVFGEFVDNQELLFLERFSDDNISSEATYKQGLEVHLSFDFNIVNTCTVWQFDGKQIMCSKEYHIEGWDLEDLCRELTIEYPNADFSVYGDCSGKNRSALTKGNIGAYELIKQYLDLSYDDFSDKLASVNPTHKASKIFCNIAVKQNQYPVIIHPSCEGLIRDCKHVKAVYKNGKFEIVKTDESLTHHLDTMRYYLHQEHEWLLQEVSSISSEEINN